VTWGLDQLIVRVGEGMDWKDGGTSSLATMCLRSHQDMSYHATLLEGRMVGEGHFSWEGCRQSSWPV
jgi:hypothetical protein